MMKLARTIALCAAVAGAVAGTVACSGTVEQPQTSASAVTRAPVATNAHGMLKRIGEALGDVPLRADQRVAIEKLASEAEARHAEQRTARTQLMLALADQIEAGAVDASALKARVDAVAADREKASAEDRAALAKLHALLDRDQRAAFVDAMEGQWKGKGGEAGGHHGKRFGKRGERFGKRGPQAGPRGDHAGLGGGFGFGAFAHMKQLGDELKLTDEQRAQIRDVLREGFDKARAEMGAEAKGERKERWSRARHERGGEGKPSGDRPRSPLEAFREDGFDAEKLAHHGPKGAPAAAAERMAELAQKIVPILTPEQRKIAADKLRERATKGEGAPAAR